VNRTHLVPFQYDGVIFLELFTHSGIGAMIVKENLNALRPAELDDIGAIIGLIKPYEKNGTLKFRDRHLIEQEIDNFTVIEHDGVISGCASLKPYQNTRSAELGCLIVDKNFQGRGAGERLLKDAEKKATKLGLCFLFALSTRATHWFIKRGFVETTNDRLPKEKSQEKNNKRASKFLMKKLF
jgi:amino-acid N-acetyltransferase